MQGIERIGCHRGVVEVLTVVKVQKRGALDEIGSRTCGFLNPMLVRPERNCRLGLDVRIETCAIGDRPILVIETKPRSP